MWDSDMTVEQLKAVDSVLTELVRELESYGPQFSGALKVVKEKADSINYELAQRD